MCVDHIIHFQMPAVRIEIKIFCGIVLGELRRITEETYVTPDYVSPLFRNHPPQIWERIN